ncbi:ubiquinol oxidase subunit II [Bradyrhizobium canariense]|uniref:Ubiquinol oxidase polypeptide II n=1 Tax=Bradyrhizobium canariense TaxID=255045 RepID=A0A1H1VGX9_9BRAD|nr:ubiquinol oxidase subunit II [Bradyrhizobium canariense]SDS84002.1 cytochrome bo3 quinol oxidase subunit 2 [Bradyrhizobium canariense]
MKLLRTVALVSICGLLGGCNAVVLSPSGDIALQQRDLLIEATILMLLIIVPVMITTVVFAWRYRQSNKTAVYQPDWDHSTYLELMIWSLPLLIIICLGAITWASTHLLDPYRPLSRITSDQPVPEDTRPLRVEVVALDWKWLFIYPDFGVATVNDLAAPVDQPIEFRITSSSVMNSFYVPALAGQIYAMPAMQTQLKAVINSPGVYEGFSANYSGAGFSGMHFTFRGLDDADFKSWIAEAKTQGTPLDRAAYLQLERPSENEPVHRYSGADATLFKAIVELCVEPSKMCTSEMGAIDAKGGLGITGLANLMPLEYDKYARRGAVFGSAPSYVASLCTPEDPVGSKPDAPFSPVPDTARLVGAGLPRPSFTPLPSMPAALPIAHHRSSSS